MDYTDGIPNSLKSSWNGQMTLWHPAARVVGKQNHCLDRETAKTLSHVESKSGNPPGGGEGSGWEFFHPVFQKFQIGTAVNGPLKQAIHISSKMEFLDTARTWHSGMAKLEFQLTLNPTLHLPIPIWGLDARVAAHERICLDWNLAKRLENRKSVWGGEIGGSKTGGSALWNLRE
ncbi:hypothetical protein AVEN_152802-1 [Araneus ventricosus]|uniref:Uncharacterized protein n=1 Tax=Araneus ventricosus TaxID=182803 RepID=A0A4Y2G311_ARAVE|nr:hypothetical protein AVEN_152802-1 [Araneus ventricosus]